MNKEQLLDLRQVMLAALAPLPSGRVSDWCAANITLPPPQTQEPGPMLFDGREYLLDVLQDFADPVVTDSVACFGSQSGKTTALMGGVAWTIINDPTGVLWVMPSLSLAQSFSETRWQPMIMASEVLERLVPRGLRRHDFKKTQQQIGSAIVNFIGSNSPGNLASRPARLVILDEVDKFDDGGRGEADAVNLAEQRTKSFSNPKRIKTSTPTMDTGLIWQEFLKGDQQRYNVPCPHCGKLVVLAWSKQFSTFRLTGNEAFVAWDQAAKTKAGWNLELVERSAHCVCPFCAGEIEDGHKTRMVRDGRWVATNATASVSFKSRHLPSLYASSPETSFGRLAVKFLQAKQSLLGLQGFINGDLAEPYVSQDTAGQRTEIVRARVTEGDWHKIMTVDCQAKGPDYFWFVVRQWQNGNSQAIDAGSLSTWDEVRAKQMEHGVDDAGVVVDSGFGARSDAEVYRTCAEMSVQVDGTALLLGWMPSKGMPGRKRWRGQDGALMPYAVRNIDPYLGTSKAGQLLMPLFEFSGDSFKDVLDALRRGQGGYEWAVSEAVANDDYWRHMDAETKTAVFNKLTGKTYHQWQLRSKHWPNHMFDCEVMQVAAANYLNLFTYEEVKR